MSTDLLPQVGSTITIPSGGPEEEGSNNGDKSTCSGSMMSNSADPSPPPSDASSCSCPQVRLTRTVLLRTVFVLSLATAAAMCSSTSYTVISRLETDVGRETYESVAASAVQGAQAIAHRKIEGGLFMASIMSFAFPDAHQWPFVELYGYTELNKQLAGMSLSNEHGLAPLVDPDKVNVSAFEDFMDNMYRTKDFEDHVGYSDFGFGIWKKEVGVNTTQYKDGRLHDTEPNDYNGTSNHTALVPLIEVGHKRSKHLLVNLRAEPFRRAAVDSMLDCANYHEDKMPTMLGNNTDEKNSSRPCLVVSDMFELLHVKGPAGLIYTPVYPAHDPNTLVGITSTVILWEDVLKNIVPDYVDGLICVISTDTQTYSFDIQHGQPVLLGDGDLHEIAFDHLARSVVLDDYMTESEASVKYVLTVYPTTKMMSAFRTSSPWVVALGFVLTIAICTGIFLTYDWLMRYEVSYRQNIMEIKRQYMRFVSHEIRTPLNTVVMGLELIEDELRGGKKPSSPQHNLFSCDQASSSADAKKKEDTFLHEVCVDVQENANTAVQMLNDILDYDKVESSTLKLELDNVPIWTLISKTIQQFQVQALGSHVALRLKQDDSRGRPKSLNGEAHLGRPRSGSLRDFESGVHCAAELEATTVIGDGTKLGQVFRNIISNALKFTPPDGTINVRAIHVRDGLPSYQLPSSYNPTDYESQQPRRAGSIRIQFKDSGVGMTREQLGKLFNEGIQFDVNRLQNGGGSGLGLVISKGIVEQHGGTVSVTSGGIGHGTTFTVELPLFHLPSEPSKTMDDSTAASIVSVEEPPEPTERRVLVVDDVMSNRKMLVRLLERAGHTCDTATNGEAAIRAVEGDIGAVIEDRNHVPFDCILMDYEMPIMNGPDATERIRDLGFGGLILGVTGNVLAEDTDHFLSKGADEIIAKPVKIAKLQESWERLTPSRKRKWSESKDGNVDSQQQRLFDV